MAKTKVPKAARMKGGTVALVKGMEFDKPKRKEFAESGHVAQMFLDGGDQKEALKLMDSSDNERVIVESRAELKRLIAWLIDVEKSWHLGGVVSR